MPNRTKRQIEEDEVKIIDVGSIDLTGDDTVGLCPASSSTAPAESKVITIASTIRQSSATSSGSRPRKFSPITWDRGPASSQLKNSPAAKKPSTPQRTTPGSRKRTSILPGVVCYCCMDADEPIVFACPMGHGMCASCHDRSAEANGCIPTQCQYMIEDVSASGAASSTMGRRKCLALLCQTKFIEAMTPAKRRRFEEMQIESVMRAAQAEGEVLRKCEKCNYMEVDDADGESVGMAWRCGNPNCRHENPRQKKDYLKILQECMVPVKCPGCKKACVLEDGCTQIHCSTPSCGTTSISPSAL